MDEHRHKVLVALVFFMAIRHVMAVVVILQQLALHQHYGAMTMMVAVMVEGSGASGPAGGAKNLLMFLKFEKLYKHLLMFLKFNKI